MISSSRHSVKANQLSASRSWASCFDRFTDGYEGSAVFVDPLGIDVLASAKGVPVAGWYLAASLPTAEAFAPIRDMLQRMRWTTMMLTLLAGGLIGGFNRLLDSLAKRQQASTESEERWQFALEGAAS